MAEDPNTLMLFVRLALSFGMVLGLVGGVTWVLRRKGLLRPNAAAGAGGRLEVLDRKSVGKNASLVLARVGDTAVLLGVTGERIQVVSDRPGLDAAWRQADAAEWDEVADELDDHVLATTSDAGSDPVEQLREQLAATAATAAAQPNGALATHTPSRTRSRAAHPRTASRPASPRTSSTQTGGARRTGLPVAAPAAGRTRMSFIEALQELTVRRS